ncbi:MAG: aminopeptidase P family protein [Bacteroidales bacterium]|nr:aminopeptidase P family protein [Bacteroidales bacterium]
MKNIYAERIEALRNLMSRNGWEAVIVSGSDPHSSEYPALRWQQVRWLTGFTGEAGDVVITMDHAGLWTDSRYFIQAVRQLEGTGVVLHKTRQPDSVNIPEWLASQGVSKVAFDGLCLNVSAVENLVAVLSVNDEAVIIDEPDMLNALWKDRPAAPVSPVATMDVGCFGGVSRAEKLSWLRKQMLLKGVDRVLLTALDEIAWLLNVRGNDIEYNPVVISYLLVSQDNVKWFVRKPDAGEPDPDTVDSYAEIEMDGVGIEDYDAVFFGLSDFSEDEGQPSLFVDPSTLNHSLHTYIKDTYPAESLVCGTSPVVLEKAVKVESEIENLRQTHIDDGLAVTTFLHWLETEVTSGREVTEWEASEYLTSCRAAIPGYRGNSFENISAYGPGAALPHYSTPREGSAVIRPVGLYLVDSGGHYLTGTTDITRTVPMGETTELEKEDYTLVLKGMIALSMAVFPRGTAGCQLDVLARMPLWKARRNFGHGTGHGIGYWLCVHEGPQDIRQNFNSQPLLPGMITSNEPGLYREGMHGIRHENIILCKEAGSSQFGDFLEFETLTCCHIDTSAVIRDLLDAEELNWLNAYNERVYRTLSPLLPPETAAWLRYKTMPL